MKVIFIFFILLFSIHFRSSKASAASGIVFTPDSFGIPYNGYTDYKVTITNTSGNTIDTLDYGPDGTGSITILSMSGCNSTDNLGRPGYIKCFTNIPNEQSKTYTIRFYMPGNGTSLHYIPGTAWVGGAGSSIHYDLTAHVAFFNEGVTFLPLYLKIPYGGNTNYTVTVTNTSGNTIDTIDYGPSGTGDVFIQSMTGCTSVDNFGNQGYIRCSTNIPNNQSKTYTVRFSMPINGTSLDYIPGTAWSGGYGSATHYSLTPAVSFFTNQSPSINLPVPLLKQTDISWGLQLYDSADKWSPLHSTIAEWGCALTSAAMVLQYQNITKLPDGTSLDPGTLNAWLNSQKDGYVGNGLINWLAISRLTKQAKTQNPTFAYDALTYKRSQKDDNLLAQDLSNGQPDILEEPGHFVVGTGQTNNSFSINDPYYTRTDLTQGYNNTYLSMGRYIPSHTDLSYIMLVTDPSVDINLTDSNNVSTGSSYLQDPLTGDQDPGLTSGDPVKIFYDPQPQSGTYVLKLTGQPNQPYSVTAYLYDRDGNVTDPIVLSGTFDASGNSTSIIKFDNQSVANDQIIHAITFDTLIADINALQNNNQLQSGAGNAIAALAKNASKSFDKKNSLPAKVQLIALQGLLDVFHNRGVSDSAYNLLNFDVQYLLNSL